MTAPAQPTSPPTQPPTQPGGFSGYETAAAAAAAAAFAAAYGLAQLRLRTDLIAALVQVWRQTTGGFTRVPSPEQFISAFLPTAQGAQRAMSAATVAQLQQEIRRAGKRPIASPVKTDQFTTAQLRGVDPKVVYARPIAEVRYRLSQGATLDKALEAGARRAQSITTADLQLAKFRTANAVLEKEAARGTVQGYRRVLSGKGNSCAMCILAATQRYTTSELAAMHPGCGCSVLPIIGDHDPGRVIDPESLRNLHDIIARDLGQRFASAAGQAVTGLNYKDIIVVNEHGELGPVLGVRDHRFSGPDHIPRLTHDRVNPEDQADDGQPER